MPSLTARCMAAVLVAFPSLTAAGHAQPRAPTIDLPDIIDDIFDADISEAIGACPRSLADAVLEPAIDAQGRILPGAPESVEITCSLTLEPGAVVTKRLVFTGPQASGVTLNCNGATIDGRHWLRDLANARDTIVVRALNDDGVWRGAENITVKNCNIRGSARIYGLAVTNTALARMSYSPDHTANVQAAGSRNIVFDNVDIEAHGRNPFYVMTGVMNVTLSNSRIHGRSAGVAVYLDAESADNVIRDNDIGVDNAREAIAIDGSARNLIVGNRLSGLNTGGIFLYRNCGERGVIRHQGAEDNVIIDNIFYYNRYTGSTPAVWIASRERNLPGYCGDDEGADVPDIGSSLDHLDHAYRNVVTRNRFIKREPAALIRVHNDPSYVFDNVRNDNPQPRNSPCYAPTAFPSPLLEHGATATLFDTGDGPRCDGRKLACNDGALVASTAPCATLLQQISTASFGCQASGDNAGCSGQTACADGTTLRAVKAACNLEFGAVSDAQVKRTPWSFAGVVKRSDNQADGQCRLGEIDVSENGAQLGGLPNAFGYSCAERDRNGGDCHVRGEIACERRLVLERAPDATIREQFD